MKKISVFLLVCLSVLSLVALSSCHGSRAMDPFVMPDIFDTDNPCEISFWYKNDTNKTQVQIYEKAVDDFEALYPNVHITTRPFTAWATA